MTSLIIHDIYHPSYIPLLNPDGVPPPHVGQHAVAAIYKHPFSAKIAFFGILGNFEVIFRGEGVEIAAQSATDRFKRNSRAVQISTQICYTFSRF